jgi:hypothetical protein
VAYLLIVGTLAILRPPVSNLAALYNSQFALAMRSARPGCCSPAGPCCRLGAGSRHRPAPARRRAAKPSLARV